MSRLCQKVLGFDCSKLSLESTLLNSIIPTSLSNQIGQRIIVRTKKVNIPRLKFPLWHLKKERTQYPERLTQENAAFIKDVTHEKFGPPAIISGLPTYQTPSPLKNELFEKREWTENSKRCGLITRKIGCYPMWDKEGDIVWTTLLQVADNHVVKYIPPEENNPTKKYKRRNIINRLGALLIGAESCDPQRYTREYCGLFAGAGLPPKRMLFRFHVSPNAVIQPGTPLFATHFSPGDVVDVAGLSIDRGFQGVMKRWGFKGMPATHGVTKTHRRGGNIGGGGEKARVWPGTKMPGHMGNNWRVHRGLKVWRINTKYNVLYLQGLGVPGETNSVIHVFDTLLPNRKKKDAPKNFPTFFPGDTEDTLPEDLYDEDLHVFDSPSISFQQKK